MNGRKQRLELIPHLCYSDVQKVITYFIVMTSETVSKGRTRDEWQKTASRINSSSLLFGCSESNYVFHCYELGDNKPMQKKG